MGHLPRHHGGRHHRHLGRRVHLAPPVRAQEGPRLRPRHQPRPRHRVGPRHPQYQRRLDTRARRRHVRPGPDHRRRRVRREAGEVEEEVDCQGPDLGRCCLPGNFGIHELTTRIRPYILSLPFFLLDE